MENGMSPNTRPLRSRWRKVPAQRGGEAVRVHRRVIGHALRVWLPGHSDGATQPILFWIFCGGSDSDFDQEKSLK